MKRMLCRWAIEYLCPGGIARISSARYALSSMRAGRHSIFKSTVASIPFWDSVLESSYRGINSLCSMLGEGGSE